MSASRLALGLRKLGELGFKSIKRPGSARCFVGELQCAKGPVKVRLEISDWDFTTYPTLVILERPAFLPALTPHVSSDGVQCYFMQGRVVLDRYRPDHAIWQCIEQAQRELDRLSGSPTYREREFEQEFGANWEIGQRPLPAPVLLAEAAGDGAVLHRYVRRVMRLRRRHGVFRRDRFFSGQTIGADGPQDIVWLNPDGSEKRDDDWHAAPHSLAFVLSGEAGVEHLGPRGESRWDDSYLIVLHAGAAGQTFKAPAPALGAAWRRVFDTCHEDGDGDGLTVPAGGEYAGAARCVQVFQRLAAAP
jgi:hypothetical protein